MLWPTKHAFLASRIEPSCQEHIASTSCISLITISLASLPRTATQLYQGLVEWHLVVYYYAVVILLVRVLVREKQALPLVGRSNCGLRPPVKQQIAARVCPPLCSRSTPRRPQMSGQGHVESMFDAFGTTNLLSCFAMSTASSIFKDWFPTPQSRASLLEDGLAGTKQHK